jgi:hypothetical protein
MMKIAYIIAIGMMLLGVSCSPKVVVPPTIPVAEITFRQDTIALGQLTKGARAPMVFSFTNTGTADLEIEIVTTCKCTSIDWPRDPIAPGATAEIRATYDTTNEPLGPVRKTLDIVANTDPIVVEAFFTADVVAP